MKASQTALIEALEAAGYEAMAGKGGYWVRENDVFLGHLTVAQARRLPRVEAPPPVQRSTGRQAPWGEYAAIAAMNRRLQG